MIYYYVMIDFYPDLEKANEYEEVLIPYHTYEEAVAAIEATMDLYEGNNELGVYKIFWLPDTRVTAAFITIRDGSIVRAFRFEIAQGDLGMLRIK